MNIEAAVRQILKDVLVLGDRAAKLELDTPLLGAIPEMDSMAVVNLIGAFEEHFDVTFDDGDICGESFATFGSVIEFVHTKVHDN